MIFSAIVIASAMQLSRTGEGLPSHCASFRAARIHAAISREEIQALDAITKKLALPAAQEGPQNQIESKPAIETADAIESLPREAT